MKLVEYKSLIWTVKFNQAESVEEYNALANAKGGKPRDNACLEDANSNQAYRGQMPTFRDGVVELLEKTFGMKRTSHTEERTAKDGTKSTVEIVDEKDAAFIKRVAAEKFPNDPEAAEKLAAATQADAEKIALGVEFDPSEAAKVERTKKVTYAKHVVKLVDDMIAAGKQRKLVKNLTAKLSREVADDRDSLLAAVTEYEVLRTATELG